MTSLQDGLSDDHEFDDSETVNTCGDDQNDDRESALVIPARTLMVEMSSTTEAENTPLHSPLQSPVSGSFETAL